MVLSSYYFTVHITRQHAPQGPQRQHSYHPDAEDEHPMSAASCSRFLAVGCLPGLLCAWRKLWRRLSHGWRTSMKDISAVALHVLPGGLIGRHVVPSRTGRQTRGPHIVIFLLI